MILNEDFFDDIETEDIVNTESDDTEKNYQRSVSLTYIFDGAELVDENYKHGSDLVIQFNKIYRRINTLFNNAPFISDYKINICSFPIYKCNAVRKFGPYDIHYNDSKSDVRMSINIKFDSEYTTLSNIVNFFLQLFKSRISNSNFIVDLITIENPKHYIYGDYSIKSYNFMEQIGNDFELAGFDSINSNIKFLSEEFCKPGSYSKYTIKRGINNGRYLIIKYFFKATGIKYVHTLENNVYIDDALDDINIDNYYYGLYNPKNVNNISAELGNCEEFCTRFDLENTDHIKIENKLKEFFREPHPAYVYTFRSSILKPYLLYCFDETLIIDDIEYVVYIYDSCLKTDDEYKKANFIKLMTPYKGSDENALEYYKNNFNVQMTQDEYEEILSILEDKSYYETKS